MGKQYRPRYRRPQKRSSPFSARNIFIGVAIIALGFGCFFIFKAFSTPENFSDNPSPIKDDTGHASFVAVGDNIPNDVISKYADACAGETGDKVYDYNPIFSEIKSYITKSDLAYINFETHAGGDDIGPKGYPSFNTTSTMVDAVYDTGFNLIASATNHSYDWGAYGALEHSANLWKKKPVLFTGTAISQEDADEIKTFEAGGITVSLLNYTYGLNGYAEDDVPGYAVNYLHEDRLKNDISQAKLVSDFVLVALHWGTEYRFEPDDYQLSYAQIAADAGADIVLGSHPHVIGPLKWVEGIEGNKTLVAYSLGNFLSHSDNPASETQLQGMLQCNLVKDKEGKRIENISWTPLVNHAEEGNYRVFALKDYSPELAARHEAFGDLEDPIAWLKAKSLETIGTEFPLNC